MRSNEVTIRFSPISRDMMEIQTRKWCQCHANGVMQMVPCKWCHANGAMQLVPACRAASEDVHIDLLASWSDLSSNFSNWPFNVKKCMLQTGWTRRTRWCHFYFRISHIKKVINEKPSPWKTTTFHLVTSGVKTMNLRSSLIEKRHQGMKRAPQCFFFRILPSYHTFGDNSDCLRKSLFSQNLTFGGLWWPQYWPDLKITFFKIWDLVAVYLMSFTACRYVA